MLQDAGWASVSLLEDEEDIKLGKELGSEPYRNLIVKEAETWGSLHRPGGAREFFWATLAPFTLCACFGVAVLVSVLAAWLLPTTDVGQLLRLSGLVLLLGAALLIPSIG